MSRDSSGGGGISWCSPGGGGSNSGTPGGGASNRGTPWGGDSNRGTPIGGASNSGTPRGGASNSDTPRVWASNRGTPRGGDSKKCTPGGGDSKKCTPGGGASNRGLLGGGDGSSRCRSVKSLFYESASVRENLQLATFRGASTLKSILFIITQIVLKCYTQVCFWFVFVFNDFRFSYLFSNYEQKTSRKCALFKDN